jgi:hypothetical protein
MTIIENHFFVVVTSKKQGNGIIESKLYIIYYIYIIFCQLNVSCGQDSVTAIVLLNILDKVVSS